MKASGLDGCAATPYGNTSAWTEVIRLRVVMDGPRKGLECVRTCLALRAGCQHYGGTEVKFISVFINPTYSLSVSDACEFPRDTVRIHPEIKIVHK